MPLGQRFQRFLHFKWRRKDLYADVTKDVKAWRSGIRDDESQEYIDAYSIEALASPEDSQKVRRVLVDPL